MAFWDSIASTLGFGPNGSAFQAQNAPIVSPTSANQADAGYNEAQRQLDQQNQLVNALQAQNGIQNQSNVFNQLQGVANGTGPNPAQAALNNATGNNVANQAALMASARGSAANPGLIARQAAQQGAGIQQNAAGQAAALQANQSLGALNQLSGIAGQQVGQLQSAVGTGNQLAQNEQGTILNAIQGQNNAAVSSQNNVNSVNGQMAQQNGANQAKGLGSLLGGISGAISGPLNGLLGGGSAAAGAIPAAGQSMGGLGGAISAAGPAVVLAAKGGQIGDNGPKSMAAKHLFASKQAKVMKTGGQVSGTAPVKGNSYKNDTQPALLSAGEIVIPRSVTKGKDPVGDSAKFVAAILSRQGIKK